MKLRQAGFGTKETLRFCSFFGENVKTLLAARRPEVICNIADCVIARGHNMRVVSLVFNLPRILQSIIKLIIPYIFTLMSNYNIT